MSIQLYNLTKMEDQLLEEKKVYKEEKITNFINIYYDINTLKKLCFSNQTKQYIYKIICHVKIEIYKKY